MAAVAGFCGAVPFGLLPWIPIEMLAREHSDFADLDAGGLLAILIATLPLVPFLISAAFLGPRDWPRVLGVTFAGLCLGDTSVLFFMFLLLVFPPAALLGLVLGLAKLPACWRDGDAAGRSLALLGMAPVAIYLASAGASEFARALRGVSLLGLKVAPWLVQSLLAAALLAAYVLLAAWVARRIRARLREKAGFEWPGGPS